MVESRRQAEDRTQSEAHDHMAWLNKGEQRHDNGFQNVYAIKILKHIKMSKFYGISDLLARSA